MCRSKGYVLNVAYRVFGIVPLGLGVEVHLASALWQVIRFPNVAWIPEDFEM